MECDKCGDQTFVIYIDKDHNKLCGSCYDKEQLRRKENKEYEKRWMDFFRRTSTKRKL